MFSFSDGKYDEALSLYTKAIDLNPQVPAYYGNRSFCYIKTEYFGSALEDANKAIDLDKKYIKVKILLKKEENNIGFLFIDSVYIFVIVCFFFQLLLLLLLYRHTTGEHQLTWLLENLN